VNQQELCSFQFAREDCDVAFVQNKQAMFVVVTIVLMSCKHPTSEIGIASFTHRYLHIKSSYALI